MSAWARTGAGTGVSRDTEDIMRVLKELPPRAWWYVEGMAQSVTRMAEGCLLRGWQRAIYYKDGRGLGARLAALYSIELTYCIKPWGEEKKREREREFLACRHKGRRGYDPATWFPPEPSSARHPSMTFNNLAGIIIGEYLILINAIPSIIYTGIFYGIIF